MTGRQIWKTTLESFKFLMYLQGASDVIMCRAFQSTLKGLARQWFSPLKPRSLSSFVDLGRAFLTNFMSSRIHKKTAANMLAIRQQTGESIREFLTRFNNEALEVRDLNPMVMFQALSSGIRDRKLKESLIMEEPTNTYDLYSRCEKHIKLAEVLAAEQEKESRNERKGQERKEQLVSRNKSIENREQREGKRKRDDRAWVPRSDVKLEPTYTPLTHRFHQDHGQDTEECRRLKDEIEGLIQRGRLNKFVKREGGSSKQESQEQKVEGEESSNSRKNQARTVCLTEATSKKRKAEHQITFSDEDLADIQLPHDDVLVVKMIVPNWSVARILVDNESLVNVLYFDAFLKMQLTPEMLKRIDSPLYGFNGASV
ncbi:uncharacterized protein LOC122668568 [Telopea speciosissima]|uniref:uncharacterized protein LOC122668568 n=1 Tax=Telopea speciosissima TaxID=54955 RepID=UPI001CC7E907|nr:uncharacterized protein LOC122668568 [Telopea speciosissima]